MHAEYASILYEIPSMTVTLECIRAPDREALQHANIRKFSSKVAFVSLEQRESAHDASKMKRVKLEEPRSQECVQRAALGSPQYRASASSAQRSVPGVLTIFTIPEMSEIWTLLMENASVRIRDEGASEAQPRKLGIVMKLFTKVNSCQPFLGGDERMRTDGTMGKLVKVGLFDFKKDILSMPPSSIPQPSLRWSQPPASQILLPLTSSWAIFLIPSGTPV